MGGECLIFCRKTTIPVGSGENQIHKIAREIANGISVFSYFKSCEYTDKKVQELNTTVQELKLLIYDMINEIDMLNDHNKSLSERLHLLEKIKY